MCFERVDKVVVRVLAKLVSYQSFEKLFGAGATDPADSVGLEALKEDNDLQDCIVEESTKDVAWLGNRRKLQGLTEINKLLN